MAASARTASVAHEQARINEKDNLLRYQISDDKEENDLLEGVMGPSEEEIDAMTGTMKRRLKEGEMISTDAHNKTVSFN